MRKWFVGLLAATVLLVAACGGSGQPSPSSGQGSSTPAPAVKEKQKISVVMAQYSDVTAPYWDQVKKDFEAANPDISVDLQVIYWDQLHQRLATMIGGNQIPDMMNVATAWVPEYTDAGIVAEVGDIVDKEFKGQFIDALLNYAKIDGKMYGLPIAVSARALYYNKDLFEKNGVKDPPKTWDELVQVAGKLNHPPDYNGFASMMTTLEGHQYFAYFLWSAGGDFFKDGKYAVNSPEGKRALQFMVDLINKYKVTNSSPTSIDRDEMQKVFMQGRMAMMITGPWLRGMIAKEAPNLKYGIAPIPQDKTMITSAVTDTLMLSANARKDKAHEAAVLKFLKFIYQSKYRQQFDEKEGMLPEMVEVGKTMSADPSTKAFIDLLPYARFLPLHLKNNEMNQILVGEIQLAMQGKKTPDQALDDATNKINKELLGK
jgi:multiple sugar transport system substrate-binding protein